jgi:hypothetical protein
MPKVRYHRTRKLPKFGSLYGRELQQQWSAAAGDAYPGGGAVIPFRSGDVQGRGRTANHRPRDTRPESDTPIPVIPNGLEPGENLMPEGLIDPATGQFYEWVLTGEKRVKGGLREIQPYMGGGYGGGGGRDLRPTAPAETGGGRGRDLRPSGLQVVSAPAPGANNMFNGLDPETAFSGRDPQLESFLYNRFTLGDADREWSRDMPKRHRVYGMDLGWANGPRTQDLDRHKTIGGKSAWRQKRLDDKAEAKVAKQAARDAAQEEYEASRWTTPADAVGEFAAWVMGGEGLVSGTTRLFARGAQNIVVHNLLMGAIPTQPLRDAGTSFRRSVSAPTVDHLDELDKAYVKHQNKIHGTPSEYGRTGGSIGPANDREYHPRQTVQRNPAERYGIRPFNPFEKYSSGPVAIDVMGWFDG